MLWIEFYTQKGWGWLPVRGGSMRPLMQAGDRVLISRVAAESIACGDIIVFRRGSNMIVHRLLKKRRNGEGNYFIEKGDHSPAPGSFSADQVIGRVTVVKGNGKLYSLDSPFSRFIGRALSVWFYGTGVIVTMFRSAKGRNFRRAGRVLYLLSLPVSNILVGVCSVVWYISGLCLRSSANCEGYQY